MESRFQRIFLMRFGQICFFSLLLTTVSGLVFAQDDEYDEEEENRTVLDAVISPDLKRREIKESRIDSENFEIGVFGGVMSIEDFGTSNVFGIRTAIHFSEDWFIEVVSAETEANESSAEIIGNFNLLTEEERKLKYVNVSFGINLFPGEVFIGKNYAFNTNYYIVGGVGDTTFGGDNYLTYNFGGGFQLAITDWMSFHIDFRNHLFSHSIFTQEKSVQNLESHMGLSFYF